MKILYKISLFAIMLFGFTACYDYEPLAFDAEKPEALALQEEINGFEDLKSYIDRGQTQGFKLGTWVASSDFLGQGLMYRLINRNFDEISVGNSMSHASLVQANGNVNVNPLIDLYEIASDAGLSVQGSNLIWHTQQNAGYLNRTIAPLVIRPPSIQNSVNLEGLKNSTFEGWGRGTESGSISIAQGAGMAQGALAILLEAGAQASEPDDLQLSTPEIAVQPGRTYEVIFFIRSDEPGEGRVSFEGLADNFPSFDWTGSGQASPTFQTTVAWREIKFRFNTVQGNTLKVKLDLGFQPNVKYFVDVTNFYIYDINGEPIINNLVNNGDFEAANISGWGGWGNNSTRGLTAEGEGVGGTGYAIWVNNPSRVNFWEVQTVFNLGTPLEEGEEYILSFYARHDNPNGNIRPEMQSPAWQDGADAFGTVFLSNTWTKVELRTRPTRSTRVNLIISYGEMEGTVYLDNIVIRKASGGSVGQETVLEKTQEEKRQIIGGAMESWISQVVGRSKNFVKTWFVLNDPLDDTNPTQLRSGSNGGQGANDFYWQDYLGKDYAPQAFKLAAQYGNPDDLLFINESNLESNIGKCIALIDLVGYIESNGGRVDGIGAKMHIDINADKQKIAEMFSLLAASGKKIKVSELFVALEAPASAAGPEHFEAQAEMYKYVASQYRSKIPASQQAGITLRSPLDHPANATWRPGEPLGLWNTNFNRKSAYAAFAEGLGNSQ